MKNHIIAIGISSYQAVRLLSYAAKDAKDFYYLFTNNIGDIGYSRLLIDSEATLATIRSSLGAELEQHVSTEDTLFFFFSGHGAIAVSRIVRGILTIYFLLTPPMIFQALLYLSNIYEIGSQESCVKIS